jgi:hypothetical protein
MAGFGAEKHEMRLNASKKRLKTMTIHLPQAEGRKDYIVHHDHHPPHGQETYRISAGDNADLAAHLSKHLGLALHGKASEAAESAESKENFE